MPYIETNKIKMYYEKQGAGEPLLLIMGITATGTVWDKHAAVWQNKFTCIMPDNRGVGLSDAPPGPYTSAQMADDYAGLLEVLQIEKIKVVGCSMGSIIAQQLAIRHPEKISAIVLMCPWARCDEKAKAIFYNMMNCKAKLSPDEFMLYLQLLIFSKQYWDDPRNVANLKTDRLQSIDADSHQTLEGLRSQSQACISHNVIDELYKILQPVLVIGGGEDIFTPPWMAKEMAENIPQAVLHLYKGCGHAFHWEAIDDFNPCVLNWLMTN
ncbi:MAG: alpha/beta hydrolase [Ginsengibacter sp.]